jgi:glycosyltransferase involved in cell wall biosynthesis
VPQRTAVSSRALRILAIRPPSAGRAAISKQRLVLAVGPRTGGVGYVFTGTVDALRGRGYCVREERPDESGSAAFAALRLIWRRRSELRRAEAVLAEFGSNDLAAFWFTVLATMLRTDIVVVAHDPPKIAHAPGAALIRRVGTWHARVAYRMLSPALDRRLLKRVTDHAGAVVVLGAQPRDALQRITIRPVLTAPLGLGQAEAPALPPSACDYVLFAGFLGPRKGIDLLIRAWSSCADVPLRLVIAGGAGSDSEPWVQGLRAESARFDNPPEWIGSVETDDEFDALLRDAAIVVLPYRSSSPASGVLARAMGAGRCVVASRAQAFVNALQDDVSGILVDIGDEAALSRAIQRLAADPAERDRLGSGARNRATEVFGWDKYAVVLEQAFVRARR